MFALLPVFLLLLITGGCKKTSDSTTPVTPTADFLLKGSVVNTTTHAGIANARVYFSGTTILTTDANGLYQVNCKTVGCGTYDVRVMADGYGFGFATATITTNAAMVNTIMLMPLGAPVTVGSTGGSVMVTDPESLIPGSKTTLVIPAGALSGNTSVSLTRFTGIHVPGYAPANMLNLCAVNLSPANSLASQAMELRFALPFADASLNSLALLRYDFEANTWINTGAPAQVDHVSNTATVQVTAFGTYSLAVAGSFSESNGTAGTPVTLALDRSLSAIDLSYQAANDYPGFTGTAISLDYLRNVAAQNTRINGTRTSFSDLTTVTFNYIGSKPDSLAGVKTTGYYRWFPKVVYTPQDMPMTTNVHGLITNGFIRKQVYGPASGYEFVHDQGGGGK